MDDYSSAISSNFGSDFVTQTSTSPADAGAHIASQSGGEAVQA